MRETIGQYIRTLRNDKGWTLTQLAAKLDIDSANLSKIENGKRELDEKKLTKLCKVFKLDKSEMERELVSEKIARAICDKELDQSVLTLAEEKINYIKKRPQFRTN